MANKEFTAHGVMITPKRLANGKFAWVVCSQLLEAEIYDNDGELIDYDLEYEADSPMGLILNEY